MKRAMSESCSLHEKIKGSGLSKTTYEDVMLKLLILPARLQEAMRYAALDSLVHDDMPCMDDDALRRWQAHRACQVR